MLTKIGVIRLSASTPVAGSPPASSSAATTAITSMMLCSILVSLSTARALFILLF